MRSTRDLPAVTRDGTSTSIIRANIEFPNEVDRALRIGAHGVGLYRSEFLFLSHAPEIARRRRSLRGPTPRSPSAVAPHPAVIVRTLDLGGEKYFHDVLEGRESNPVLGLRAVRFCLEPAGDLPSADAGDPARGGAVSREPARDVAVGQHARGDPAGARSVPGGSANGSRKSGCHPVEPTTSRSVS